MEQRRIPNTDIWVSPLCLGTMTFGTPLAEPEAISLTHWALDHEINFMDTANMYEGYARFVGSPGGVAEQILGKALLRRRHQVILATKVGMKIGPNDGDEGLSAAHIRREIERSTAAPELRCCRHLLHAQAGSEDATRGIHSGLRRPRLSRQDPLLGVLELPIQPDRRGAPALRREWLAAAGGEPAAIQPLEARHRDGRAAALPASTSPLSRTRCCRVACSPANIEERACPSGSRRAGTTGWVWDPPTTSRRDSSQQSEAQASAAAPAFWSTP